MISECFLYGLVVSRISTGEEALSRLLHNIFRTKTSTKIFFAFIDNEELDALQIVRITGVPEASVYRILTIFKKEGIIEISKIQKATTPSKKRAHWSRRGGGPRTSSWKLSIARGRPKTQSWRTYTDA